MGQTRVTTQNLEVVRIDNDRGLVLVKGAVPGSKGGWVLVRDAVKKVAPEGLPFPPYSPNLPPRPAPAAKRADRSLGPSGGPFDPGG